MKWYCHECESYFDEDEMKYEKELHTELAGMGGDCCETFGVCPNCGSEDIEECEKCEVCGEEVVELHWVGNDRLCDECYRTLVDIMLETTDRVSAELNVDTVKARELVEGYYE